VKDEDEAEKFLEHIKSELAKAKQGFEVMMTCRSIQFDKGHDSVRILAFISCMSRALRCNLFHNLLNGDYFPELIDLSRNDMCKCHSPKPTDSA
jgi:hypothetical protein